MIVTECRCRMLHAPTRGCDWCGRRLPPRRRRWCSDRCEGAYLNNHHWTAARTEALRRAALVDDSGRLLGWRCAHCALVYGVDPDRHVVEVNHRIAIRGRHSEFGCHHHQSGLEVLCLPCHRAYTNAQRANGWTSPPEVRALAPTLF